MLEGPDLVVYRLGHHARRPAKPRTLTTPRRSDLRVVPDHRIRTAVRDREPAALVARARQALVELGA